ncbi:Hypothetical protein CAP_7106 [Chondromyces apiculatus DSM 436]|uniref:Uncharacterized protein n=1 Tax=Chondromyces apiculatus DSM 436 TaxID=1192034 RepID=A0A017SZS8_9BACT|nr:Hypothetical protein CAP_7106 [Chondromyces apiculatus DSM 436]
MVDALRARARIAVVKGGAAALLRELHLVMVEDVAALFRLARTGGRAALAEGTGALGERIGQTLRDSEHVEDIFVDGPTLRQEAAEALRKALEEAVRASAAAQAEAAAMPAATTERSGLSPVQVRLDTLGYVAATVSKRAPEASLREALARAADDVGGALMAFDAAARAASFALDEDDPDARLELEEAIEDELSAFVQGGLVALPTVIRRVDLGSPVAPEERATLRRRFDAAAARTLLRSGCGAAWELEDARTLKVTLTPLSEQDALHADHHVSLFAREIAALPSFEGSRRKEDERAGSDVDAPAYGESGFESVEETVVTGGEAPHAPGYGAPEAEEAKTDATTTATRAPTQRGARRASEKDEGKGAPKNGGAGSEVGPGKPATRPR